MKRLCIVSSAFLFFVATGVAQAAESLSLQDFLGKLKESSKNEKQADREREARFLKEKNLQKERLIRLKEELKAAKTLSESLRKAFDENFQRQEILKKRLSDKTADMGELFGVFKQNVGDTLAMCKQSLVSAQIPNRHHTLEDMIDSDKQPSLSQLESYWLLLMEELCEMGRITEFEAKVMDKDGREKTYSVLRFGVFTAIANGQFLSFIPETQKLYELTRQPAASHRRIAGTFGALDNTSDVQPMVIDPSCGSLLSMLVKAPTLEERFHEGGVVGYGIAVLAVIGLLITLERMLVLFFTSAKVKRQLKDPETPKGNNPLGRVLAVYEHTDTDTPTDELERKLDEAILRELPSLQRGTATLKIIYSIAPLLGLLGTVTGMIVTFQTITLFGAGDPRLMAGGISQALVTTALGLMVAVPMVLCHSLVSSKAEGIITILEQQSAGLLAQRREMQ